MSVYEKMILESRKIHFETKLYLKEKFEVLGNKKEKDNDIEKYKSLCLTLEKKTLNENTKSTECPHIKNSSNQNSKNLSLFSVSSSLFNEIQEIVDNVYLKNFKSNRDREFNIFTFESQYFIQQYDNKNKCKVNKICYKM